MGPPFLLIDACTTSDRRSDQPQLVRHLLCHLLHSLALLEDSINACMSIDVHACYMLYMHEWNGGAVTSPPLQ